VAGARLFKWLTHRIGDGQGQAADVFSFERERVMRVRLIVFGLLVFGLASALVASVPGWLAAAQAAPPKGAKSSAAPKEDAKPVPSAAVGGAEPTLIGQFGSWGAYSASPSGRKICFALAKPSSSKTNPPNRPRDPAFVFVSTRPSEKVANEVSVSMGYQLKPGSEGSMEIGSAKYAMYTQGDGLWIKNAAEESQMVDALRRGADVTVKGVSAKGTETTDVFSLKGLAQALDRVAQDCRR
jgi:invasion protein IalB